LAGRILPTQVTKTLHHLILPYSRSRRMANSHIIPALLLRTTFSPKIFNASHYWQCFALL